MRGVEMLLSATGLTRINGSAKAASDTPKKPEGRAAKILARIGLSPDAEAGIVTLYIAEELLFCTNFILPAKTANIKEAIRYQLDMLLPFPEDTCLSCYTAERGENGTRITIYALSREFVEPHLSELVSQGRTIGGMFPLSQRHVTRALRKEKWALLLPGGMDKLFTFEGGRLRQRLLCPHQPNFSEAQALSGCEKIFSPDPSPESIFLDAGSLLATPPLGKDFNLLPKAYRKPDYFKFFLAGLVLLNLFSLLMLLGTMEYRFHRTSARVDEEIAKLQPDMKKIAALKSEEVRIEKDIARFEEIGRNPDLIAMLSHLTTKLPPAAYLDQIRMEKKNEAIHIDGYADDMSDLSERLQGFGEVRLRSTSRRNNKNYFQLEINLP